MFEYKMCADVKYKYAACCKSVKVKDAELSWFAQDLVH